MQNTAAQIAANVTLDKMAQDCRNLYFFHIISLSESRSHERVSLSVALECKSIYCLEKERFTRFDIENELCPCDLLTGL